MELETVTNLKKVLEKERKTLKDDKKLEAFEQASRDFENLVKSGLAKKRGYNLMTMDKKHLNTSPFNSNLNK